MDVTIVDNKIDRQEVHRVMNAYADMSIGNLSKEEWNNRDKYPRKQWLYFDEYDKGLPFTVVDNRYGECLVVGFSTLDGAILYLCECHITCDDQESWDYNGAVKDRGGLYVKEGDRRR